MLVLQRHGNLNAQDAADSLVSQSSLDSFKAGYILKEHDWYAVMSVHECSDIGGVGVQRGQRKVEALITKANERIL